MKRELLWVAGILAGVTAGMAQAAASAGPMALIDAAKPLGGWTFDNGREFPGATGELTLDLQGGHDGAPALVLKGDFTKGGNYVQASRNVDGPPLRSLSFWIKFPGADSIGMRLVDAGGTCHQIKLALKAQEGWQRVQFPAAEFFATMGAERADGLVLKYEHWGKNKEGNWQGGLKSLHVLLGRGGDRQPISKQPEIGVSPRATQTLWLSDIAVIGGPAEAQPAATVVQMVALDEVLQAGEVDWTFDNGQEFKGAKGTLTLLKDTPEAGQNALRLAGDFSGGGAYVQAMRKLTELASRQVESFILTMRSSNCPGFNVRLVDGTGQCHQHKGMALPADGQWHDVAIKPSEIAGGEHWGGANDGKWHSGGQLIAILIGKEKEPQPVLDFARFRAQVTVAAQVAPPAYREGFELAESLKTWQTAGAVAVSAEQPFVGKGLLQLTRTLEAVNQPVSAAGPSFPVRPGSWQISGAGRSALHSPDASYQGVVTLELLDGAGKSVDRQAVLQLTGENAWHPFRKQIEAPAGAAAARFRVELEKTYGTFGVDELAASFVEVANVAEKRIERVMAAPSRLGGMFLPDETPTYKVSVSSAKPLRPEEQTVTAVVSDYWGAEQGPGQTVALHKTGFKEQAFQYEGELKLEQPALAVGKFYRLHLDVPVRGDKPFRHTIGVAKLAEPATKRLPPESVPFTIRNWDSRIKDYFFLTDRIGIRLPGIWGGWDSKAPYKAHAPSIEFCDQLGMKWVTGTPAAEVERGQAQWSDPAMLRAGMTNFLTAYAKKGLAYIALGNEPHGGPEQIAKNIAAYKAVYEAVKAFDPSIKVIATSVEPNEEYFRQGYQNYCDIYDFHIYESYPNVRKTIEEYKALMRKYHAEKPIFSTELGLNCQGMSRLAVSEEMVKKFAVFFAAGGANASWFTIMYPDGDGKLANSSGQAFNVFDCRYNQFNPKLDAVTLYQAVNGIANKTFRAEQQYGDGNQGYLFANADGECLLIVWNDQARTDIGLPLPGIEQATAVLLDGTSLPLTPANGTVTVTVSAEPVMLLFRAKDPVLAAKLAPPSVALSGAPPAIVKGKQREITVHGAGLTAESTTVTAPSGWQTACRNAGPDTVACTVTAPAETAAQSGRLVISRLAAGKAAGSIVVDIPVENSFGADLRPLPATAAAPGGVQITLTNHSQEAATLRWEAKLDAEHPMTGGTFRLTEPERPRAGFGEAGDGTVKLAPAGLQTVRLPLRDVDAQTLYHISARVSDEGGHEVAVSRFMAGFVGVRKGTPQIDGDVTDACWAAATPLAINEARQFFPLHAGAKWKGPEDLTASIRFLWDEKYLYLGVHVTDDVFVGTKAGGDLWNQDGLQLLADPGRGSAEKMGYYDYWLGMGTKGQQMWCGSTASPAVPVGEVKEARVAMKRGTGGNMDYEAAIPWPRLAPFVPAVGADLGLALIVNDDDGAGRNFTGWFSGVHSKEVDMLGDLILQE